MSERWKHALHVIAAAVVAAAVCFYAGWRYGRHTEPVTVVETKVDTLVVRDTITAYKPTPVNVYVVDTLWYEVPIYNGRDTVYVEAPLPRERKVYQDSTYRAVVSGFRPSLDTISVFRKTVFVDKVMTVYAEPSRWSVGLQAGYGASKDGLTPYVGVGVQYRLWAPKHRRAPP